MRFVVPAARTLTPVSDREYGTYRGEAVVMPRHAAARRLQAIDTGMSHLGFRCVRPAPVGAP
jgi:hypothetical protein